MSENCDTPAGRALACVSAPPAPLRVPSGSATLVVIVVIAAFALLTVLGVPQAVALAGLTGAGALGLRLAARLVQTAPGGGRA